MAELVSCLSPLLVTVLPYYSYALLMPVIMTMLAFAYHIGILS